MSKLAAFVGHSFAAQGAELVSKFTAFFDEIQEMGIGFTWEHAEAAEPKLLSDKVREKIKNKNLFIGICTAREHVISPEMLKTCRLKKDDVYSNRTNFERKTSDWILQEIGCAFGREMDIILLNEEGLRDPGSIWGDLEYITFSRSEPGRSFTRILQMIKALTPKEEAEVAPQIEKLSAVGEEEITEEDKREHPTEKKEDWTDKDYENALLTAMLTGENEEEENLFKEILESEFASTEYEKINWQAKRKYYRTRFRISDHLNELLEMKDSHPEHDLLRFFIGLVYLDYEQYEVAAGYFEKSAQLVAEPDKQAARIIQASIAISKAGQHSKAISVLGDAIKLIPEVTELELGLMETLADIFESADALDFSFALSEAFLEMQPDNHDRRFSLAWNYSSVKEHDLALFHYKLISKKHPNEAIWNNTGVAYSDLRLPAMSVDAYMKSVELGGTLSTYNLAQKLIRIGFLDQAEETCNAAMKIKNYDKSIGYSINRVKEVREKESNKEEKVMNMLNLRRSFYVRFGRSCLEEQLPDTSGILKTPQANIEFTITGNSFNGSGTFKKEEKKYPFLPTSLTSKEDIKFISYITRYEGKILGRAIKYKQWTHIEDKKPSDEPNVEGLMVAASDIGVIEIYVKGSRDEEEFYSCEVLIT